VPAQGELLLKQRTFLYRFTKSRFSFHKQQAGSVIQTYPGLSPGQRSEKMTLGSILAAGRHTVEEMVGLVGNSDRSEPASPAKSPRTSKPVRTDGPSSAEAGRASLAVNHPSMLSPTESKGSVAMSEDTVYHTAREGHESSKHSDNTISSSETSREPQIQHDVDGLNEKSSSATIVRTISSPRVPPRPIVSRPGGLLSRRRAGSSRSHTNAAHGERSADVRTQTMSSPNMRVILAPEMQREDLKQKDLEFIPSVWDDVAPEASEPSRSPPTNRTTDIQKPARTPLSLDTEASNDTVVDWSHNTSHPEVPTMTLSPALDEEPTPTLKRSFARKPKKPAPASLDLYHSARSDDTVVQWSSSSLKKSPRLFDIHKDLIPTPAGGPPVAADQTPPPAVSLLLDSVPRGQVSRIPMPLKETTANATHSSPSPHKKVQLSYPSTPHHLPASPSANGFPEAPSITGPRPLRSALPSFSPIHPPTSSPQTFTSPGPPPTAPPLPPRHLPPSATPPDLLFAELSDQLQHALHRDLRAMRREIHHEFEKQKLWFENLMRDRDQWVRRTEEENGRLREELARGRVARRR